MIAITYAFGCLFLHLVLLLPVMELALDIAVSHEGDLAAKAPSVDLSSDDYRVAAG